MAKREYFAEKVSTEQREGARQMMIAKNKAKEV